MMKKIIFCCFIGLLFMTCRSRLPIADLSENRKTTLEKIISLSVKDAKNSKLVIAYEGINHEPVFGTKDFYAIVYDRNTKKKGFFFNCDIKNLNIKVVDKTDDFRELDYILDYYINGKEEFLKSAQHHGISHGSTTHIYDVDFKNNSSKVLDLEDVLLKKDGQPATFQEYMRGE